MKRYLLHTNMKLLLYKKRCCQLEMKDYLLYTAKINTSWSFKIECNSWHASFLSGLKIYRAWYFMQSYEMLLWNTEPKMGPWGTHLSPASSPKGVSQPAFYIPFKCCTKTSSQWNIIPNSLLYSRKIRSLLFPQNSIMNSKNKLFPAGSKTEIKNLVW